MTTTVDHRIMTGGTEMVQEQDIQAYQQFVREMRELDKTRQKHSKQQGRQQDDDGTEYLNKVDTIETLDL